MDVDMRLSPGVETETIEIRFWTNGTFLGIQTIPAAVLPTVHF